AQRLLMHGGEVFFQFFRPDLFDILQRLDVAAQHRDRRAQLMRHVCHEGATHLFEALQSRDVAREDQFKPGAERTICSETIRWGLAGESISSGSEKSAR